MYRIYNLKSSDNVEVSAELGPFTVITHLRNLAPSPENRPGAIMESYYAGLLMDRKRQLICQLNQSAVLVAAGMMQWMVGDCKMVSDANGLFGYLGKQIRGKTTGQNCIAPKYSGSGTLVLEPVDEDIMLVNLQDWQEGIVIEKGLFLAAVPMSSNPRSCEAMFPRQPLAMRACFPWRSKARDLLPCAFPVRKRHLF